MAEQMVIFDASDMVTRTRKPQEGESIESLEEELKGYYERYEHLIEYGGNDPSWPDGVNVNLTINHIMYTRKRIKERAGEMRVRLPEIMSRAVPEKVDRGYMARSAEIRKRAHEVMQAYREDPNRKWIVSHMGDLSGEERRRCCVDAVLNYQNALESAIEEDEMGGSSFGSPLTVMRRHNDAFALESTASCRKKIELVLSERETRTAMTKSRLAEGSAG